MSNWAVVVLVLLGITVVYAITIYNGLVSLKHAVGKHLANIDVLLKQRHEELPKLVASCNQYMRYEQATLERVIGARNQVAEAQNKGDLQQLGAAETSLRKGIGQLFALAENYPELKANKNFQHLQQRISGLENAIADRREVYNESVNNNNIRLEQFPDIVVARFFNFNKFELLEFSEAETLNVDIKTLFEAP